jgi:hypothetical protein
MNVNNSDKDQNTSKIKYSDGISVIQTAVIISAINVKVYRTNGRKKKSIQNFGCRTNGILETGWKVLTGFLASSQYDPVLGFQYVK